MAERAGNWLRVSKNENQDELNQTRDNEKWISDHKYEPVKTYRLRKSAYKGQHNDRLEEVIRDMQDGTITVLVVWQSSRIERRGVWNAFDLARRVKQAGGRIEYSAPGDRYLNEANEMSDVQLAMAAWKDNKESKDKSERVRIAQDVIRENSAVLGRLTYGYRIAGDRKDKHPVTHKPEADVIREAIDRYLNRGESLAVICDDFNARGIPGPSGRKWLVSTLGRLLRNPTIAGVQMNNRDAKDQKSVIILEFDGIITWPEHEALVARLNSRAHRKGIAPFNVFMMTGLLSDEAGHQMYGKRSRYNYCYACRKGCTFSVRIEDLDAEVTDAVMEMYGALPHMVRKLVPGTNYLDQIGRRKFAISHLDPESDEDEARRAVLKEEIRQYRLLPTTEDHVDWVPGGQTVGEHWQSLSTAGRHDWLIENGWKVSVSKVGGELVTSIDAGFTAEVSADRQAQSLGFPVTEYQRALKDGA
jgi:DNA invertase Pin-like site-specific DNA recombinase